MHEQGWRACDIAAALGVTRGAVSQWLKTAREAGLAGLAAQPRSGAPRRMSKQDLWLLPDLLSHGAEAYGFTGDVWTCRRVGHVIEQEFDVTYDRKHIARMLKQIGWTPQKPLVRASQRDEGTIAAWRNQVWPEVKKERVWNIANWFSSMNPATTCCRLWHAAMRLKVAHPC
jgi:transposase